MIINGGSMTDRHHRAIYQWLAMAAMLAALAGCEHGDLSFDHSSGTFSLPIGEGSSVSQ